MIECSERNDVDGAERSIPLLFGKALLFFRVCFQEAVLDSLSTELGNEFCFVQYYQIVGKEKISIVEVDAFLNCIKLQWDRTLGEARNFSAAINTASSPVTTYADGFRSYLQISVQH